MAAQRRRPEWIGTQLQVLAVSGLERSHTNPFVRVIYKQGPSLVENESTEVRAIESCVKPMNLIPERRSGECYTAVWEKRVENQGDHRSICGFELPDRIDRVELQIWNHFVTGFEVFLSKTVLSLEQLRLQSDNSLENNALVSTGLMWIPLQLPNRQAKKNIGALELSAQINISFIYDDRILKIRDQIRKKKAEPGAVSDGDVTGMTDPTFAFAKPFMQIDWGLVASTGVRHLFFHNDVEHVLDFQDLVLYGDIEREMNNDNYDGDDPMCVDPGHFAAFRLLQFAAQYLVHCVDTIESRVDDYSAQFRTLTDEVKRLRRRKLALDKQHRQLESERDQLSLVVETYERLQHFDGSKRLDGGAYQKHEASEHEAPLFQKTKSSREEKCQLPLELIPSLDKETTSDSQDTKSPLSAKKPAFIMTWEDRERERQREKEATKAQRIIDEQRRLQQRLDERASQDRKEKEDAQYRNLKVCAIQRAFKVWTRRKRGHIYIQQRAAEIRAAVTIQACVRCRQHTKAFPKLREQLKREREQRLMTAEDDLSCRALYLSNKQCIEDRTQPDQVHASEVGEHPDTIHPFTLQSEAASAQSADDAELLVSMWRKLRKVFHEAARPRASNGNRDFWTIFRLLDLRRDGAIDRSELRRGMELRFNVHMDRKLTRGLLALIRCKAGEPPRPLVLSYDQFCKGLDLQNCKSIDNSGEKHDEDKGKQNIHSPETLDEPQSVAQDTPETCCEDQSVVIQDSIQEDTNDDDINKRLLEVAAAAHAFRRKLNTAARAHLTAAGNLTDSYGYFEFRAALSHIFEGFDTDGSGALDLQELRECLDSMGVRVSDKNMALVRECFCSSTDSHGLGARAEAVTISDFTSFVLANSSMDNELLPHKELGLLGYRVRNIILARIESAREQLRNKSGQFASLEDGLRWVFRFAYPGKTKECGLKEFGRALRSIKELKKIPVGQVVRLAACFDADGDLRVSFDELLLWLRLEPPVQPIASPQLAKPLLELVAEPIDSRSGFQAILKDATVKVGALIDLIKSIASTLNDTSTGRRDAKTVITAVFDRIDHNHSGKIVCNELAQFFSSLPPSLVGSESNSINIAKLLVDLADSSANRVISREEWLRFMLDQRAPIAEEYSVRMFLRNYIASASSEQDQRLAAAQWLEKLPGAVSIGDTSAPDKIYLNDGAGHCCKVRVREFQQALRKIIDDGGSVPTADGVSLVFTAVNAATKALDKDGSRWITTKEFVDWILPTRDVEEIIGLLRTHWEHELERTQSSSSNLAEIVYTRFDVDRNGCLAQRELQIGFRSVFALELSIGELEKLIAVFDTDGDRCWNRQEFITFTQRLTPAFPLLQDNPVDTQATKTAFTCSQEKENALYLDDNADDALSLPHSDLSSNEEYSELSSPSVGVSRDDPTEAYSASFQESSPSRSQLSEPRDQTLGVQYDDDFEE